MKMPPRTPEHRAKLSEASRRRWASPEARAKQAERIKVQFGEKAAADGWNSWKRGCKRSPEAVEKMAASKRGRPLSDSNRAALRAAKRGPMPQAQREAIRAAHLVRAAEKREMAAGIARAAAARDAMLAKMGVVW